MHDLAGLRCADEGATVECVIEGDDAAGVQACAASVAESEPLRWGSCVDELPCTPGEVRDCSFAGLSRCLLDDQGDLDYEECGFTPLAIDLGGGGFELEPAGAHHFDIAGSGVCLDVDWPVRDVAWLALDRDGDGAIADGRELFGSGTPMPGGTIARDGFAALATLDENGDGSIGPQDPAFARLVLWSDHDGNRRGTAVELIAVAQLGIADLPLDFERRRECDARGNCVVERSWVTMPDGPRQLVDLHLACQ